MISFLSVPSTIDFNSLDIYIIDATCIAQNPNKCMEKANKLDIDDYWFWASFSWSPDSSMITFHCGLPDQDKGGICIYDFRTGNVDYIIDIHAVIWDIEWSPDGEWIAYTYVDEDTSLDRVRIEKIDGSEQIDMVNNDDMDERVLFWFIVE